MNNLQSAINKSISYETYGIGDLANKFEIKDVIDTFDLAKEYFKNYDFSKTYDLDTISDYYLVKKICYYRKLLSFVVPEYKKSVEDFLIFYEDVLSKFNDYKISEFFNLFISKP